MAKAYPINFEGFFQQNYSQSANVLSNLAQMQTFGDLARRGKIIEAYYQKSLATLTDATIITSSSTTLTAESLDDYVVKAGVIGIGKALSESQYDSFRRGEASLQTALKDIAVYVNDQVQKYVIAATKGAFTTALASTHYQDYSGVGTGEITLSAIRDLRYKLGEWGALIDTITLSTKAYKDLQNSVGTIQESGFKFGMNGLVETVDGLRILINDSLCAVSSSKYPFFLSAGRPIFVDYQSFIRILEDENILVGGGTNTTAFYADFALGIKGVSWATSTAPTSISDYETGSNYSKVDLDRNILILKGETL